MDHFAEATLGSCDGVFPKSYLEGATFSAKRLAFILKCGIEKRRNGTIAPHPLSAAQRQSGLRIPRHIAKLYNIEHLDGRVASQIDELGSAAFWGLIQKLFPDAECVFSYAAPGASGAYVFKANVKFKDSETSTTGAKQFLIKVSPGHDSLLAEARNRQNIVRSPVPRTHFPSLLHEDPINIGGLSGIAYEFETDHETLLVYLARELRLGHRSAGLGKKLVGILKMIYGDTIVTVKDIWRGCYDLDESAKIRLRSYLLENKLFLQELVDKNKVQRVEHFLMYGNETLCQMSKEIDTRYIHGDFNCGNILISVDPRSELSISIIDLGSRKQDHIIKDVAKLERDIVFRVFDWGSSNYHDPNRISAWRSFLSTLAPGAVFDHKTSGVDEDQGVAAAKELISELRSAIRAIDLKGDEQNYLIALLHYSLLAILHPRISTAKKAFAVEYASGIIESLTHNRDRTH